MKKTMMLIMAMTLLGGALVAQNSKLVSADSYMDEYQKDGIPEDLIKAKEALTTAADHEKTKDNKKTWFYFGKLYFLMAGDSTLRTMEPNALEKALESFERLERSEGRFFYQDEYEALLDGLVRSFFNAGLEAYNAQNYGTAYALLQHVEATNKLIAANDVQQVVNTIDAKNLAATSAILADSIETGMNMLADLYEETGETSFAMTMAQVYSTQQKYDEAKDILTEVTDKEPENADAMTALVNVYLAQDSATKALDKIDKLIELDPENDKLYFVRGSAYQEMGDLDKALADYEKAVELNPENADATYMIGASYYLQVNPIIEEKNELGFSEEDQERYDELEAQHIELFRQAKPYFEKALELNPDDANAEDALNTVNRKLSQVDDDE